MSVGCLMIASRSMRAAGTQSLRSKAFMASATTSGSAVGGAAGLPQAPSAAASNARASSRRTLDVAEAHAALDHRVLVTGGARLGASLGLGRDLDANLPNIGQGGAESGGAGVVVAPDLQTLDATDDRHAVLLQIAAGARRRAAGAAERVAHRGAGLIAEAD